MGTKLPWRASILALVALAVPGCVAGSVGGVGEVPVPDHRVPSSGQLVVAVVDGTGNPLPGATVTFTDPQGTQTVVTDADGQAALNWRAGPVSITAEAPGLLPGQAVVVRRPETTFSLALRPVVLRGMVVDPGGYPLSGASVRSGTVEALSGPDGRFELARAVPGEIVATHPGRVTARSEWTGDAGPFEIVVEPLIVRALHVDGAVVSNPTAWSQVLELADDTVVDGLVIDLRDASGRVFYDSRVEVAREIGAVMGWFRLDGVLQDLADHGLYAIGRIVAFIDPLAARSRPAMAVWDQQRDSPYVSNSLWYLDPSDPEARAYAIDLALETCRAGFAEVQFDHVAFPLSSGESLVFDGADTPSDRAAALRSFTAEAVTALRREGCAAAVNVLGSTMTVETAGNVGQDFAGLSEVADVLSPTVYPSAYSENWFGFEDPSAHPGRVVALALDDGLAKLEGPAVLRPWLQDFSYDAESVRAQISSAEERGLGWMLWNGQSIYSEAALERSSGEPVP